MSRASVPPDQPVTAELLARVTEQWERIGYLRRDEVLAGLSDDEIITALQPLGVEATEELLDWWRWTAGLAPAARRRLGGFFSFGGGGYSHLSIDEAVKQTTTARTMLGLLDGIPNCDPSVDRLRAEPWVVVAAPGWAAYLVVFPFAESDAPRYGVYELEDAAVAWRRQRSLGGMLAAVAELMESGAIWFDAGELTWHDATDAFESPSQRWKLLL